MGGNSFGRIFRITTYGESHGKGIGVVIDGCPSGLEISEQMIYADLKKRKPGQSSITTDRNESDYPIIQSGVYQGKSTGAPINIFIPNEDQRSEDYTAIQEIYRPSHADYTYQQKYGIRDFRGGGRSSARETAARVAAGAIAKLILSYHEISITTWVSQIGPIKAHIDYVPEVSAIESSKVRCPVDETSVQMEEYLGLLKAEGDTTGGIIRCHISGCPIGLGEPVFDKLQADLAKAMLSINAAKAFQYGSGFDSVSWKGSQHNDEFYLENGKVSTSTNHSGGIQGGISNGMPIFFDVGFKPVSTLRKTQNTIDTNNNLTQIQTHGRHDPCVVPRAVPIVEAMAALVIADHLLVAKAYEHTWHSK